MLYLCKALYSLQSTVMGTLLVSLGGRFSIFDRGHTSISRGRIRIQDLGCPRVVSLPTLSPLPASTPNELSACVLNLDYLGERGQYKMRPRWDCTPTDYMLPESKLAVKPVTSTVCIQNRSIYMSIYFRNKQSWTSWKTACPNMAFWRIFQDSKFSM